VFVKGNSGKMLYELYLYGWELGLKTTYYLRTLGLSQIEKATLDAQIYGLTQKRDHGKLDTENGNGHQVTPQPKLCKINDPTCEACQ
jgi:ribonucleoside-diphosphate reductase alpha chain